MILSTNFDKSSIFAYADNAHLYNDKYKELIKELIKER